MKLMVMPSIAAQSMGAAFSASVSFGLMMFLGREMGTAHFGDYVALLSLAVLALILIEGGWPTLVYRESVASRDAEPATGLRLARQATLHLLTCGALLSLLAALALPGRPALAVALACMGVVALMNLVSARMRGAGRFALEAIWQGSGRTMSALLIVGAVLWLGIAAHWVFLAWAVGLGLVLLAWGRHWLLRPDWRGLRGGYTLALPFFVFEGLVVLLLKGDVALLQMLRLPAADLSSYAACTRLTEAGVLLFAPVGNVLLRSLRLQTADASGFGAVQRGALIAAASLGVTAIIGSVTLGDRLMPWLFGDEFLSAGALLPWVALMLPFALCNLVLFQVMIARDRERTLVLCLVAATVLLLIGLAIGCRFDGARGAAQAVALTQAVLLALCALVVRRMSRTM